MNHLVDFDRAGRLTASQAAAALGMCKFTSRGKLWRQITGREAKFEGNEYTQYGNDNEHNALETFEAKLGVLIEPGRFVPHPKHEWLGASPDGFLDGAIVEAKCPQTLHECVPEHYKIQMMVQMDCCDALEGWFVSWTPEETNTFLVLFDEEWFSGYILKGLDMFWNHYVLKDIEPPRGKFNPEKELK